MQYNNTMHKIDENTGIEILYRAKTLHNVVFDEELADQFNKSALELGLEKAITEHKIDKNFNIPKHYKELDVEEYIRGLVPTGGIDIESCKARVEQELALYKARNLYPVLQLMIYIIDTMRKHKIVWGVGRGSSVASYCLYLIGVHKVDSIKYDLNIREFLK